MTFEAAEAYLLGTINETASRRDPARLDRMRALLRELGDPQNVYPTIHVGGTSGKGSTSTMIAAALTASGERVGLHTKPHVTKVTERARIDGIAIPTDEFGDMLEAMMPAIERTAREHGRPSYYETLLALSFLHFAQECVDIAVVEVGVGGSLDGTNVITPLVSVITNVGLDHTEVLGDTVEEIAKDKVGIAKPGVPLVSDVADAAARSVIEAGCAAAGAPFFFVRDHARVEPLASVRYGQAFAVTTSRGRYEISLPVLGNFQKRNAATAIVALESLPAGGNDDELRPSIADVERGFSQLMIPGRMEFFPAHPSLVFDIAHNPDKARSLAGALLEEFPGRRFTFVIAVGESKNAGGVLEPWLAMPASFVFTSFTTAGRTAVRPQRLAGLAQSRGRWARAIDDPVEALSIARRSSDASNIVVVTGSTFLVATLRDWWVSNVSEATVR
jgi:dihydrofolate synthase/folylpolyglutamate synthase